MKKSYILVAAVAAASISYLLFKPNPCETTRIAFDLGSGAIKSEAAVINTCENKIVKILDHAVSPIKLANCMQDDGHGPYLEQHCIEQSLKAFFEIQDHYKYSCAEVECSGIATEWARQVSNSQVLINLLKEHHINIKVVDQQTEGEIGFKSAFLDPKHPDLDKNKIVVWDVGGASFQLSTIDQNNQLYVFEGRLGVEVFEGKLREVLNKARDSNHPFLNKQEIDEAITEGKKILDHNLIKNSFASEKIESHQAQVLAIGRPFIAANHLQMGIPIKFTKQDLLDNAYKFIGKTHKDITTEVFPDLADHYVRSAQVALIMMYVIMDAIDVEEATTINSTMTRPIFLEPEFWGDTKQ